MDIEILKSYPLCHRCFGRLYAKLLHTSNYERGRSIKMTKAIELESKLYDLKERSGGVERLKWGDVEEEIKKIKEELSYLYRSGLTEIRAIEGLEVDSSKCPWCKGIFQEKNLEKILEKTLKLLSEYEYDTFLVGTLLPKSIKKFEERIKTPYMESIKQEFNRTMGKLLIEKTSKTVERENPDIVILINPYKKKVKLQITPVYIKGRYRKLVRGIPQTRWPCGYCKGKGCEKCNFTGKKYTTSVEEIIAGPFMEAFKGKSEAFHGAGREDIDVRMLGDGRPFVLEIKEPKVRKVNLEEIGEKINKSGMVEVLNLEYGTRKDIISFKNKPHKKTYLALVECEEEVSDKELSELEKKLENLTVYQRTPQRVSHRRADLVRIRKVYKAWTERIDPKRFKLKVYCDGGLYIKELISGDDGRTSPSVSKILNKRCVCKELDVLKVHDE
ncbi:tRNA pseudouridine(54/55) synthase Pus10 [Methanofervidicoccus abyssi]|uniref:tRNA pseudouridine synthase Pus10 n=1 Tax=Methanofervidicoccus abyssi TaxID=2082189 RepID=A0A401HP81_9EURY|nr:tRNA pseudouridine synthase 10 [Methanofervidicoccus abyssi]